MKNYMVRASGLAGAARGALCAALDTFTPISGLTPDRCPDIPDMDLRIPFPGLHHIAGTDGDAAAAWNVTHADMALIVSDKADGRTARLAALAARAGVPHAVGTPEHIARAGARILDGMVHGERRIVVAVEGGGAAKRLHARTCAAVTHLLTRRRADASSAA